MENYICINGKKAELTEEQLKALGIELPKVNPFERITNNANTFYGYYFIDSVGHVIETYDGGYCNGNGTDDMRYRIANYCTDKAILEQRALHETLNRLLWRFKMENDNENTSKKEHHFGIRYDFATVIECHSHRHFGEIIFNSEKVAYKAIREVIEPFMKAHPDFKF